MELITRSQAMKMGIYITVDVKKPKCNQAKITEYPYFTPLDSNFTKELYIQY